MNVGVAGIGTGTASASAGSASKDVERLFSEGVASFMHSNSIAEGYGAIKE
jgi:hypothetical protein